ncbi:hypothetical protein [Sinorhizobium saheli]|uniref:Secreted protein n=1 Tax=Sinorhizobium saheli TaxID=36856 RepID=A0A178XUB9_SINSA|nr:hypothetical protein [Sinorhizobium saheli]MQW89012.1 hypothetical protein [Sinorhizobium saheli]OAP38766.1 hypothetical protein ATB98_05240 [Sinorhizobium saheli]
MKSILVFAASFALATTTALAACPGHDTTASADAVDKEVTTASVTKAEQSTSTDMLLLQQGLQQKQQSDAEPAE